MKVLITGSAGFIGAHLVNEFKAIDYEVICCDLKASDNIVVMDIMNPSMVTDVLMKYKPDVLINMAGQANVGLSWKKPQLTMQLNAIGVINILESVKKVNPRMRVITVGSSDEYGNLATEGVDVTEDIPIRPITPYAISKQTQEMFAKLYSKNYGMDVCMVRLFNLGGSGQAKGYMISDFASGIAEIEAGEKKFMMVGNLEGTRDFTHVKDACRAIRLVVEKGRTGEIYNIASGIAYKAKDILDKFLRMTRANVEIRQDPAKMRPSDTLIICGNHDKLTEHTGWVPIRNIDEILVDALTYWRKQMGLIGGGAL